MRQIRRNWWSAWEDLHPLARGAVLIVAMMIVFSTALWGMALFGPRMMSLSAYFKLRPVEQIWALANVVLAIMMAYTLLRLTWMAVRKKAAVLNVVVVCAAIAMASLWVTLKPPLFAGAVQHETSHSYGEVLDTFTTLCDEWSTAGSLGIDLEAADLGVLSDYSPWRESTTVFFDFGDENQAFGLACVVTGDEPFKTGRRSRDFEYHHIRDRYYEFITKDAD
ncbi:MAG: hypothetical protein H6673_01785 [Anaerolineales bacterium]|nr:hypothetical protein [Anaerolineales bacterium]